MLAESLSASPSRQDDDREPFSESAPNNGGRPITVVITRAVREGSEEAFEATLRAFIPKSLTFPGHLGVFMLARRPEGESLEPSCSFDPKRPGKVSSAGRNTRRFLRKSNHALKCPRGQSRYAASKLGSPRSAPMSFERPLVGRLRSLLGLESASQSLWSTRFSRCSIRVGRCS